MEEKYRPLFIRIGIIIVAIIFAGIALSRFLGSRADQFLAEERAKADRLGWRENLNPTPSNKAHIEARALLASAHAAFEADATKMGQSDLFQWPEKNLAAKDHKATISRTDRAAQILADKVEILENSVKVPIANLSHAGQRGLAYALSARAIAFGETNQPEKAKASLRLANLIANLLSPVVSFNPSEADATVNTAWCRLAAKYPSMFDKPLETSPAVMAYAKKALIIMLRETQDELADQDPTSTGAKREEFDRLREGNERIEEFDNKVKDLYSAWQFMKTNFGTPSPPPMTVSATPAPIYPSYTVPNSHGFQTLSSYLRDRALREQLTALFLQSIQAGGASPSSLGTSRDPFNSSLPLTFKKLKTGFILYSFGPDSYDGGGTRGDFGIRYENGVVTADLQGSQSWR